MADKPIDLNKAREAKAKEEQTQSPTMKPKFDADEFFAGVIAQNRKAKAKAIEDKRKHNALTKRRYKIKDTEK